MGPDSPMHNNREDRADYRRQMEAMSTSIANKARRIVAEYVLAHLDKTDVVEFDVSNVYVVWSCKTLQNWKVLLSTTVPDGRYYEVTYDGDRRRSYLDVYTKFDNRMIPDSAHEERNTVFAQGAFHPQSSIPITAGINKEIIGEGTLDSEGFFKGRIGDQYADLIKDNALGDLSIRPSKPDTSTHGGLHEYHESGQTDIDSQE